MVLYDFLYLDRDRVDSFYAQLFEGYLKQIEKETSADQKEAEKVAVGIKPFMNGELSGYKTIKESKKETVDPEQIVIIDTLSILSKNSYNINKAKQGDIVKVSGNLHIATNNMLKMFVDVGEIFNEPRSTKEKKELKKIKQLLTSFLNHVTIESIMLLKTGSRSIVGSLKKEFLREDPETFQLKYGASGMDNVTVLGFYESDHDETAMNYHPSDDFISSSKQFAEGIKNLFFPPHSSVITPIAIYKEIEIVTE
ncbi:MULTISPECIES: hypothetical protein [unclassified Nitratiruptor]|uniref:DUF6414 family protein n=1 Tax=unclassified Nitratiruptor TaxID=2624044 RepID=UPI00191505DF|nr:MULTISPECIES: hypothetical protein [unclassified Nitratiruptor]BCD59609.1 hypothetical protein NitYY0810_C0360 [Nitratiruptor sp. YY08-10]BCD63533.1 hypothetical protein NitYY0814_C0360 [Nitratiruptor sp. YY08-14]BCD83085.1 hypothetical protein NrS2_35 [Nitratiruptor phage NrS-2]BCD83151.1 hypothetical protein NrS3_35 [Nitratiruptor phage NrS-3]